MNKTTTQGFSLITLFFLLPLWLSGQMIWPGDINNNGIVNGIDYLYWGVANQNNGPARPDASTTWEEQPMGAAWATQFPGGINQAYADANGDGQITAADADALGANFNLNHGTLLPDAFQTGPLSGGEPDIYFEINSEQEVASGETGGVIMGLATELPFSAFYGITFTLNYQPGILAANDGVLIGLIADSFLNPDNSDVAAFVNNNSATGKAVITIVRTDQNNVVGGGKVARILLNFADLTVPGTPDQLNFTISNVRAIDHDMNTIMMRTGSFSFSTQGASGGCPNTVNPVCGSNGQTYLNSCYAEAAGIYNYTPGACFDDSCIDPTQINPDAVCPTVYQPVCGCNDVTYPNECAADAAGVQSTTPGPCAPSSCYDPQYIVTSAATTVNTTTGVITANCPTAGIPVCGCNGVTYANACLAEASGITVYTQGSCESACVDPFQMNLDAVCPTAYQPVCGCNNVTYSNACLADAAGVTSYTNGPCNGGSAWCSEAIPVQCGDFLPYETTVGAGNNILQYPGCTNTSFYGPDRVYVINKQSAGDLQIGLEILTPGMDLDLFLLADNCSQLTCLAKSTTSNVNTNNEGIILEDAPIGTYYIVVDGQYAQSEGTFRLEVSCGYLFCGNSVPLQCGQSYQGTNLNGHDDVSLYGCDGNVLNVENNGPEIVHTFTTTQAGPVSISLTGLSANLELFLLRSCDRGDCMEYSQNSGNNSEYINEYLPAGTYYVVVDGYNGAVSNYTLLVDCSTNSSCNLSFTDLSATSSGCGQNSGSIHIGSSGGTPNYLVTYSGPLSGSFTTSSNSCTIYYLPPGTYTITKTDAQGCTITGTVTILGGGNLSATLTPYNAVCMDQGSIGVYISNGQGPYQVYITGPTSGSVTANSNNFTINNLNAGNYTIHITDALGCSISQQVTINHTSGNFIWNYTVTPAACGGYGAIHVNTYNGEAPYNILVSGPISGGATVYANSFNLINLPGGTYQVTVEDNNWCSYTRTIVIPNGNLTMEATPNSGVCGQDGSITVNIDNGSPAYTISWTGPENGSTVTNSASYVIPNLTAGTYTINVVGSNGCSDSQIVTLSNSEGGGLTFNVIPLPGSCSQNGALWIDIYNGSPTYTISYTGPQNGVLTTSNDGLDIPNLPCGYYTLTITDMNGCSGVQTVELGGCEVIDLDLAPQNGICGQPGSLLVTLNGGSPIYTVTWTGPVSGSTTTSTNILNLPGLPAGTYTVQVVDANGCTDYAVAQVSTAESNLVINTSVSEAQCGTEGTIFVNLAGGVPPYQLNWSGPESGSQIFSTSNTAISGLMAGNYTLYVTDGNGCSATTTEEILNIGSNLDISLLGNNGICSQFGNIGVYIANGTAPYQISWNGPVSGSATSPTTVYQIQNTPAGTYNVVVTDANGCSTSGTVQIMVQNNLMANLQVYNGICGSNGSILVNVTQGNPSYTITWSGPQSGSIVVAGNQYAITGLPSGTYTVVITDSNGCSRTLTGTVTNTNGGLEISTALIYNICGQYNTIWTDIIGGTPPYTVTWQGTQNGSGTTTTQGFEIMDLPPGTYKVIVVDANGCMDMEQGIIIYPAPMNLFTVTPNNGICGETGSIQVDIDGGTAPYVLNYNGPVSGTQNYNNPGISVLNNLPGGTYTFTLTDANGCTQTQTVVLNTGTPVQIITALIYNECGQYNTIWTDIIGGTPPYTVTWQGTQNGSGTTTTQGFEIVDLPPGTYKVIVVDANGCMDMEQDIIIYPAPVNIFTATADPGVCGTDGKININVTGGTGPYSLTYTGPLSGTISVVMGLQVLSDVPNGTYTLTLTDANGCTETETVTVTSSGTPVEIVTALIYNECGQYNTIWVDIIGGTPPYTVTWQGTQNGSGTTTTQGFEIIDLPPGTYKVIVVDANGCMDMEQGIIVYPAPINIFSATSVSGTCAGPGSIVVNILDGTPNFNLTWTGPVSGSGTFGGNIYTIPNLPAGTYTLTLTDMNGCTETEVVVVSTSEDDVNLTANGTNGNCISNGSITAQGTGGDGTYVLTWTGPESGSANISNAPFLIPDLPAGTYTLSINDGNGCDDVETVTLSTPEDDLQVSLTPTPGDCNNNGQIAVVITGGTPGFTISWSGPSSGSVNIGGQFLVIPNLPAGTYTVTVVSNDGCTETTSTVLSNPGGVLTVAATPIAGVCGQPGYIFLNIGGGNAPYQVSWTGPSSGSLTANSANVQIPGLLPGGYTITVGSGNCNGGVSSQLPAPAPDLVVTATSTSATCGAGGSIHVSLANFVGSTTISWSGPQSGTQVINGSTMNIPNLPNGSYTITATNGSCSDITQVTVNNANGNIVVYATPVHAVCNQNGSINVGFSGGQAPYTISWTGPSSGSTTTNGTSFQIPGLNPGTYTVTVSSGNCSGSATATINNTNNNLSITAAPQNGTCLTNPGFVLTFSGGTAPYLLTWQGPVNGFANVNSNTYTLSDVPTGLYSFMLTDANGCTISTISTVSSNTIDLNLTAQNGTCGDNTAIFVNVTNGTGPYQISWVGEVEGFATSNSPNYTISNLPGSPYIVTVQDANGCVASDNITVVSGPTDFEVIHTVSNNGCGALNNIWMDFFNGVGDYTIQWIGPSSGTATTTHDYYDIQNAPTGIYIIIITDGNGCVDVQQVEVYNILNTLDVTVVPHDGSCGGLATIDVYVDGGTPWYTIAWYRNQSPQGEIDINSNHYTINNLVAGTYYVVVTDDNGCDRTATVTVATPANLLQLQTAIVGPGCTSLGSVGLTMGGGNAPYSITWSGQQSGSATSNTNSYLLGGLNGGNYQITVTAASGCTNTINVVVPGTTPGNLVADFDYEVDGLNVSFTNMSSNGFYNWTFGDGNTDGVRHPDHAYANSGSYQVCLTVSGNCGSNTHCETISVTAQSNLAILDIGESEGGPNAIVQVPVTIDNVQNIISLAGSIEVMDESVAIITGVTNGVIAPQYNVSNNTFSYFNNTGDGLDVNNDDVLFYLKVLLVGDIGESTVIKFVQTPLPIEVGVVNNGIPMVVPYTLSMGSATITNMAALNGQLSTYWGDGIMNAAVTITGPGMQETMTTSESGSYNLPNLSPGMAYTVSAQKDLDDSNGLSTYALFIGQRFLLGMNPSQITSPYQIIAGDANCNDAFTTLDLFLIQRLIIGAQEAFDNCPSWVFVTEGQTMPTDFDAYNVFPYASTSTMMLTQPETANFIGVKVGDILGQANPSNFGGLDDDRTNSQLPFTAENLAVAAGEEVTLYFRSAAFADIVSYQFGLQFPANQVEYLEFFPAEEQPFQTVVIGDGGAEEGKLRLSWFSLDGQGHSASADQALFAIKFRALTDIEDWNNILRLDPGAMLPEAYNNNEEALDPAINFGEVVTGTDAPVESKFRLDQNTPNPFNGSTVISFHLPTATDVVFVIHDAFGQEVYREFNSYGAGENRLRLNQQNLPAGVYYYTLRAGTDTATRTMVVVK
ncbi:Kazal-type serine protease inhibitor domain-containing protein [Lewinella sp. LCG006]|uniref:Kazal-type serine protease inhibitor domain-containing protein n=1 Tax=Lewinella sp. LCG006 TaxID=3231911 RepID=UPI003460D6E1